MHRPPVPALRQLLSSVWAHGPEPGGVSIPGAREHVLPTGATHIALRLDGPALRIFDHADDARGHRLGHAVVGGARVAYHLRDVSHPSVSVGAVLRPGAAGVLLGVPESALAGHHTPLDQLLPSGEVEALSDRLRVCEGAGDRLALFERWLLTRAQGRLPALPSPLAGVLQVGTHADWRVSGLVRATGLSHRHCIALFRQFTGLTPSEWLAQQRLSRVLELGALQADSWAGIAAVTGFADQAHLVNTFKAMTGLTPTEWRRWVDPATPRHVPQGWPH